MLKCTHTALADLLAKSIAKKDERAKAMLQSYMKKNYKVLPPLSTTLLLLHTLPHFQHWEKGMT